MPDLAVRGDDLCREQAINRQAVLAAEKPDAAANRDAADPDRAGVAESNREPVRGRSFGEILRRGRRRRPTPTWSPDSLSRASPTDR